MITIGTGSFISLNIGNKPLSSNFDFYSIAAYKCLDEKIFILHSGISSAGIAIDWAKSIGKPFTWQILIFKNFLIEPKQCVGLFNEYSEISDLLNSTENSGGVYFISAFGYLELYGFDKVCKIERTLPQWLRR